MPACNAWLGLALRCIRKKLTNSARAAKQPRVPAPRRRHLVAETFSRSSDGRILHLISFRLRSMACSARLNLISMAQKSCNRNRTYFVGSIIGARSTILGASFPEEFFSQPTAVGLLEKFGGGPGIWTRPIRLFQSCPGRGASRSRQHKILYERLSDTVPVACARYVKYTSKFLRGQPGFWALEDGSRNPIIRYDTKVGELRPRVSSLRRTSEYGTPSKKGDIFLSESISYPSGAFLTRKKLETALLVPNPSDMSSNYGTSLSNPYTR